MVGLDDIIWEFEYTCTSWKMMLFQHGLWGLLGFGSSLGTLAQPFSRCVTVVSCLMLNLHSAASAGILCTLPTLDTSSSVIFTSPAPDDLPSAMNSFEMQATMPTQSLQADITREVGLYDGIEMARKVTVTRLHCQMSQTNFRVLVLINRVFCL